VTGQAVNGTIVPQGRQPEDLARKEIHERRISPVLQHRPALKTIAEICYNILEPHAIAASAL
jgi:hypothetical protein